MKQKSRVYQFREIRSSTIDFSLKFFDNFVTLPAKHRFTGYRSLFPFTVHQFFIYFLFTGA